MEELRVGGFRNLREVVLQFEAPLVVLVGANGSGKTSLLEAVHFLGRGRSFRTGRSRKLIQWGADVAQVGALVGGDQLGVERSPQGLRFRLNGGDVHSRAELAQRLPVQLINADHQRLLLDGPAVRRAFLDWGVFHVEPSHRDAALRFRQALRQRNTALRSGDTRQADAWIPVLASAATEIEEGRRSFLQALEPRVATLLSAWLPAPFITVEYFDGGFRDHREEPWSARFTAAAPGDHDAQHTRVGPHRADLRILAQGIAAQDALSRGQQKLLVLALLLAEAELWKSLGRAPVLLVDDLAAELDGTALEMVVETVQQLGLHALLTGLSKEELPVDTDKAQFVTLREGEALSVV